MKFLDHPDDILLTILEYIPIWNLRYLCQCNKKINTVCNKFLFIKYSKRSSKFEIALVTVAREGKYSIVNALIENGIDPSWKNWQSLNVALHNDHLNVAKYLMSLSEFTQKIFDYLLINLYSNGIDVKSLTNLVISQSLTNQEHTDKLQNYASEFHWEEYIKYLNVLNRINIGYVLPSELWKNYIRFNISDFGRVIPLIHNTLSTKDMDEFVDYIIKKKSLELAEMIIDDDKIASVLSNESLLKLFYMFYEDMELGYVYIAYLSRKTNLFDLLPTDILENYIHFRKKSMYSDTYYVLKAMYNIQEILSKRTH